MANVATKQFDRKQGENVPDPQPVKQNDEGIVVKDQFFVSEQDRKDYGVKPNEQLKWVRNPQQWRNVEFKDRIREVKAQEPGARTINHDGEMVTMGDLVLMAVPEESARAQREEELQGADSFKKFHEGMGDLEGAPERWKTDDSEWQKAKTAEMLQREHEKNMASGLIGPTQGMDWRAMISQPGGRERYEREFRQNSLRGMTVAERDEVPATQGKQRGKLFPVNIAFDSNGKRIRE